MFGFSSTKIIIILLIVGAVVGYFKYTQDTIAELNRAVAEKDFALKTTTETLKKTQEDLQQQQQISSDAYKNYQDARDQVQQLEDKFNKNNRDLATFAIAKPKEVQQRMNDATRKSFRCIEDTINKEDANATGC
jgi:predicted Holliday junction resolvase-like endonuclease